jgi:hypothetical protein
MPLSPKRALGAYFLLMCMTAKKSASVKQGTTKCSKKVRKTINKGVYMKYIATTTFMANGQNIQRGTILDGKEVSKWLNYQLLEIGGYIRRIETPAKE